MGMRFVYEDEQGNEILRSSDKSFVRDTMNKLENAQRFARRYNRQGSALVELDEQVTKLRARLDKLSSQRDKLVSERAATLDELESVVPDGFEATSDGSDKLVVSPKATADAS